MKDLGIGLLLTAAGIVTVMFVLAVPFYALPKYNVWRSSIAIERIENTGKANLAKAEQERQILVAQARAEVEAAQLRADAIAIVGKAAKEYPEYRHQEFLGAFGEAMNNGNIDKIIYVPTEANIPVMEAGKR